jgi:hypothetical protein
MKEKESELQKIMIKKTVQRSEECFIQFTEDELLELNIKAGDKFSCSIEDGSVVLKKFETIELDMSEWSRESLEVLISKSVEEDISINEVISNILEQMLPSLEKIAND